MTGPVQLTPRALPMQQRSRQTIDKLLQTTATLLASHGIDAFNTNLLAEAAGMSPRAIYRYFPNKWAVLRALAERYRAHEREWIGDLTRFATTRDWRLLVDQSIDRYYRAARDAVGFVALRMASRASPELREYEDQINLEVEEQLAVGLQGLGMGLDHAGTMIVCRVIIESINRVLDACLQSPPKEAEAMLAELKAMIRCYIAHHLGTDRDGAEALE